MRTLAWRVQLTCIENAVDERQVDRHEDENRLEQEHLDGTVERAMHEALEGPVRPLVLCIDIGVELWFGFAQPLGLSRRVNEVLSVEMNSVEDIPSTAGERVRKSPEVR